MLPNDEEALSLLPGPGSVTWRRGGDPRTLLGAGYALVLQVAHPTVGIGVAQHSSYREEPWQRLLRTLDFTTTLVYAEPAVAIGLARGLRSTHARIRGTTPAGRRYSALEPGVFAWVWATLYEAMVAAQQRFGVPLSDEERLQLWLEWRRLGLLVGVRERRLPETLDAYAEYFERAVRDVLEDNESVRGVLESLAAPACPAVLRRLGPAWRLGSLPGARALRLATVGMLPRPLRDRLGLRWSPANELELRALEAATRATTPLIPPAIRTFGPLYVRWRASRAAA